MLRILLSITLLLLLRQPLAFVVVYFLCGISDVLDGFLARHFKVETALGARLDSLADLLFFTVGLCAFFTLVRIEYPVLLSAIFAIIAAIRAINFIWTKKKFGCWSVMHTVGNKATGLLLFIFIPICVWINSTPLWLLLTVGIVGLLSAIEELVILLATKSYAVNRKSAFCKAQQAVADSAYPEDKILEDVMSFRYGDKQK